MQLCIISPPFPLPGESPSKGPDNVIYNLVKGIIEHDKNILIHIVTIRDDIKKEFSDELFPNVKILYIPKMKLLPRSIGDPIIIRRVSQEHNFDLIHAHYPIALAKILDISTPKILTMHGILIKERKYTKNPLVRMIYHDYNTYMLKKILPKVDGFVAISPYVIDTLKDMKLYDSIRNIFQINNPVDSSFFNVVYNPVGNTIFYPAVIRELKNQMSAIEAAKIIRNDLNNFKLIFAGSYDEKYFIKIVNEIAKENLSNVVEYKGVVSRSEILELYNKSSIVYLLSNQEVQPMVLLEAMATGIPVIASNLKSIAYVVEDGITGYLVNPDDHKKIAEHTLELFLNREKRFMMGDNARQIAKKRYSSNAIAEQTLEMYNHILNIKN